jgi:hypothetical protein
MNLNKRLFCRRRSLITSHDDASRGDAALDLPVTSKPTPIVTTTRHGAAHEAARHRATCIANDISFAWLLLLLLSTTMHLHLLQ